MLSNSSNDAGEIASQTPEHLVPQSPAEGIEKDYDAMAVDCPPDDSTSDFVFPCQPDPVRFPTTHC